MTKTEALNILYTYFNEDKIQIIIDGDEENFRVEFSPQLGVLFNISCWNGQLEIDFGSPRFIDYQYVLRTKHILSIRNKDISDVFVSFCKHWRNFIYA